MRQRPASEFRWTMSLLLIAINVGVFLIENVIDPRGPAFFNQYLALSGEGLRHWYVWQPLTYQFLHAPMHDNGLFHILGNCFAIYFIGQWVEQEMGKWSFLKLYLICGTVGGLLQIGLSEQWPGHFGYPMVVGASAGAFGLVSAFGALFPDRAMTLMLLPIEIRARTLVWIFLGLSLVAMSMPLQWSGKIAHSAHLGGILTAMFYIRYITNAQKPLVAWRSRQSANRPRILVTARGPKPASWKIPRPTPPEDLPPGEFISKEVDPILDKISAHGIQSLTDKERQILQAARARMSKRV